MMTFHFIPLGFIIVCVGVLGALLTRLTRPEDHISLIIFAISSVVGLFTIRYDFGLYIPTQQNSADERIK